MLTRSRELSGQAAELDRLCAHVTALGRRGRAVAVVGEPGSGKSRLIAGLLDGLEPGHVGLSGRASELERDLPFGVFADALPETQALTGADAPRDRRAAHQAIRARLEQVAAGRRCVLALDDAHWADEASVEAIAHLLRRPPAAPVLLVLALSPKHAGPRLRAALDAATREAGCDTIELRGELPAADPLPELAPPTRALLDAAAVAGDPFDAALAARIAGLDGARARRALAGLAAPGLVHPTDRPAGYAFAHPHVRRAVYRATRDAWRLGAHARAAEALRAAGAAPARLAHHVDRSAEVGDRMAVDLLASAARDATALAPASAARWYAAALRLLPAGCDPGERIRLLQPMAAALTASGQITAAREAQRDLLGLVDDPEAVATLANLERLLGRAGAARATLSAALDRLPDRRCAAAARLEIELACDRHLAADRPATADWARSAIHSARAAEDPALTATALAVLGLAELDAGAVAAARGSADEAAALVDAIDDHALAGHLEAAHWTGWCEHHLERHPDVVRHYERGLRLARGRDHLCVAMRLGLSASRMWLGDARAAVADAEAAIDQAQLVADAPLTAIAAGLRCWIAVRAGGLHDALRRAERVAETAADGGPQVVLARAWVGEALAAAGAPARGCARIVAAAGGPELPAIAPSRRPYVHGVLASAAIAAGDLNAATLASRLAGEAADALGLHGPRAWALRARGELALAQGDARTAANLLLDSAAAAGAVHPLERERSRALAGRALAAAGRRPAALAALEQARGRLAAWGAKRLADQVTRELRRLGARGGPRRVRS
jgi:hypothetical protein